MNARYDRPSWVIRFYRTFDWGYILLGLSMIALAICLIYLGIFVFTPFTLKLVGWR